jgi:CcmD family protein
MPHSKRFALLPLLVIVPLAALTTSLAAQQALPGTTLAEQSLRPYRFVFIAYAIAWALVFGWVISVARRASGLARRLEE